MKFKELLKEVDLNGAQLARRIGVSTEAVSQWVRGAAYPNLDRVPEIAKALGVSVERVLSCFVEGMKAV